MRLALGATAHAARLTAGLRVDADAVARNLVATRGLLVAERLSLVLAPVLGAEAVRSIVSSVASGDELGDAVRRALDRAGVSGLDVERLIDPHDYTGLAGRLVDDAVRGIPAEPDRRRQEAE